MHRLPDHHRLYLLSRADPKVVDRVLDRVIALMVCADRGRHLPKQVKRPVT
jgi:hypothetical protein